MSRLPNTMKIRLGDLTVTMVVRLEVPPSLPPTAQVLGLTSDLPFLRGVSIGLLEAPQISWQLTGLYTRVLKSRYVDTLIKGLIKTYVNTIVCPHKICLPLTTLPDVLPGSVQASLLSRDPVFFHSAILPKPRWPQPPLTCPVAWSGWWWRRARRCPPLTSLCLTFHLRRS